MTNIVRYSKKPAIYGTGLVALDIVISSKPDVPPYKWAGGTCGNVLTILSYFGWQSFPIARLNSDSSSIHAKNDMAKWKVNLKFAEMTPTASIPVITQEITADKNGVPKHKFHWKNCPKCGSWLPNYKSVTLNATKKVKEKVRSSDVFFFDRTSPGALDLARHFREIGALVFFEPSAKGDPKHFEEAISLSDIVKYSDQRFSKLINSGLEKHRPLLEIQTLGERGLRYRTKSKRSWENILAFEPFDLIDSCGCGDWTTAGIISKLCSEGKQGFTMQSNSKIKEALKYAQALGAWNCGFEGARSGMYQISKNMFEKEIDAIMKNSTKQNRKSSKKPNSEYASDGLCPACPGN